MPFPRRRPSPAMLVALLALVAAMSGTAVAAVLVTSPDQLAANVVTAPKLATDSVSGRALGEPSVGPDQLTDNAVSNAKLASGAVDERALSAQAVTATRLAAGSVVTSRLADGSVTAAKLANPVFFVRTNFFGVPQRSVGVDTVRLVATGVYEVVFHREITDCALVATAADTGATAQAVTLGSPHVAKVRLTRPQAVTKPGGVVEIVPEPVGTGFTLLAQC
jgi:hypothetical protein